MKLIDLTGRRFGRLTVTGRVAAAVPARWACVCDCGASMTTLGGPLRDGRTSSCGCLGVERRVASRTTHGRAGTPEFWAWNGAKQRCTNPRNPAYPSYGGRGISFCDRWLNSFEDFLADMGEKPSPDHSIDRIDNAGNYEPGNCRWATRVEQNRNKRSNRLVMVDGAPVFTIDASVALGGESEMVSKRISRGWSADQALEPKWASRKRLSRSRKSNRLVTIGGETACIAEWAERSGLKQATLVFRVRRGYPEDQLLVPVGSLP